MSVFQAFILGIVQGLTEFIPVSSSGHLVLVPWLLNWEIEPQSAFVFDVLVQWGTLIALLFYFREDLSTLLRAAREGLFHRGARSRSEARLVWMILISTLPAVVGGLFLKSYVEAAIHSPQWVSIFLLVTGAMLFVAERVGRRMKSIEEITGIEAIWIGIFQVFSLFPGISRSGATISAGLFRGMRRKDAARFSFLMVVPIMFAAGIIALIDLINLPNATSHLGTLLVGFLVAAIVGYASIHWLLNFLAARSLHLFSAYCILAGVTGILSVAMNA